MENSIYMSLWLLLLLLSLSGPYGYLMLQVRIRLFGICKSSITVSMAAAGDLETMPWEIWTHPQGWTYFSRVRTVEGGIELHEIRGALNDTMGSQSDFSPSISYGASVVAEFGGLIAHAYVDRMPRGTRWN